MVRDTMKSACSGAVAETLDSVDSRLPASCV